MITVSPSLLENYRLLRDTDWFTFEMFKERVEGAYTPSEEMDRGTALHAIIENPHLAITNHELDTVAHVVNGVPYVFDAEDVDGLRSHFNRKGLWEVPFVNLYRIDGTLVQMRGRLDFIYGRHIIDLKTTDSDIDVTKYTDSLQWKCYIDAVGADSLTYAIARLYWNDDRYVVRDKRAVTMRKYDGLTAEVEQSIYECLTFMRTTGLIHHREVGV